MSDQSLHDTATDLPVDPWAGDRPPFRLAIAAAWAAAIALTAGGVWLGVLLLFQFTVGPTPIGTLPGGSLPETAVTWAAIGGAYGLLAGAAAGLLRGRPTRLRAALAWGGSFAVAAAVGGGAFPLVIAVAPDWIPAEVGSTVSWAVVGAIIGAVGYGRTHRMADPLADEPVENLRPWRLPEAAGWASATGVVGGGCWLSILAVLRALPEPVRLRDFVRADRLEAGLTFALLGGIAGLVVGAAAGIARSRPTRGRSGFVSGFALAAACALGAALMPLAAAGAGNIPPEASSTAAWFLVCAVIGGIGYTRTREPNRTAILDESEVGPWTPAGAATWGLSVGGLATLTWLGELALLRLLPSPVTIGPLVHADVIAIAGLFAVAAGGIGLVVGATFGTIFGAPSKLTSGLVRGLGFAAVGAVGGGLFPLVAAAMSRWVPPALSSALTWGVVSGIGAVIAYSWTRRRRAEIEFEAEYHRVRRPRLNELHVAGSAETAPSEPGVLTSASSGWADPTLEEPSPGVVSGWDPEPSIATRTAPPAPVSAGRSQPAGAAIRLAPVLMVSVTCLMAVGLSGPSPVGWAMLAIGLLGLAVMWALVGQERRIRELERKVVADERPDLEE
jgi:hypothetical protein